MILQYWDVILYAVGSAIVGWVWAARGHGFWRGAGVGLGLNIVLITSCMVVNLGSGVGGGLSWGLGVAIGTSIGCIISLARRRSRVAAEKAEVMSGSMRKCPFCAELIRPEAKVCRFCGRDLPTEESKS